MSSEVALPSAEEILRHMIQEMAAGTRELPDLGMLTERGLESVWGKPTASGLYHGHPCTGVVVITARFVAIEPEEVREPHALCLAEEA